MDIDMSATRQQMLETAERLNQQMTDGIPFTWETLEQALSFVIYERDRGPMEESVISRSLLSSGCRKSETVPEVSGRKGDVCWESDQEIHVARVYGHDRYCGTYAEQSVAGHGTGGIWIT